MSLPRSRRLGVARTVAALLITGAGTVSAQDERSDAWRITPWLDLNAGYETEAIIDPLLGRAAIPGGSFLGFTPGAIFRKDLGPRNSVEILANGSFERFFEDEGRTLAGLSSWAEFSLRSSRRLYGNIAGGVEYFDDTGLDTAERGGVGGRFAIGLGAASSGVELGGTLRGRRYPNLITEDDTGALGTYTETLASVGFAGWTALGRRGLLQGELDRQQTDARDPLFDTVSWLLRAGLRVFTGRDWTTWFSSLYQLREYEKREAGFDEDSYLQLGVRVTRSLGSRQTVGLAYSYLRYVDTFDSSDDSHRLSLFYTHRFGRPATAESMRRAATTRSGGDPVVVDGLVRFRILAPEATQVGVAGDFNGWDPQANPLVLNEGGWWETTLALPAGTYQFVYVVDGEWTAPPGATTTIDDGFGGINGLFTVTAP